MKLNNFSILILSMMFTNAMVIADTFVRDDLITNPSPTRFSICHGGTCTNIAYASFSKPQWRKIEALFSQAKTAKMERDSIRAAIAVMEKITGGLTDTYNDKAENNPDHDTGHYMDCIDESTNTSLYLTMMKNSGLFRWHDVEDRQTRGNFITGWPHTTAIIRDKQTGKQYAVDSWFLDNGKPPFIIPLEKWLNGWRPDDK